MRRPPSWKSFWDIWQQTVSLCCGFLMDFARFEWMWFMTRQTIKNNQVKITCWPGFLPRGPKQRKGQRFSRSKMSVLTETQNVHLVITNTVSSCGFLHKLLFIVDTEREDNHGIPHYIFNDTSAIFKMTGYDEFTDRNKGLRTVWVGATETLSSTHDSIVWNGCKSLGIIWVDFCNLVLYDRKLEILMVILLLFVRL